MTSVIKYGILYSPSCWFSREGNLIFLGGGITRYILYMYFFLLNLWGVPNLFLGFRHRLTTTSIHSVYINQMCCYGIEKFSKIFCNSNAEEIQFFLLTTAWCSKNEREKKDIVTTKIFHLFSIFCGVWVYNTKDRHFQRCISCDYWNSLDLRQIK